MINLIQNKITLFCYKTKKYENKTKDDRKMLIRRKNSVINFFLHYANLSPAPGTREYITKNKKNAETLFNRSY